MACKKCKSLSDVFERIEKPTPREWWFFKALFVALHGGERKCKGGYVLPPDFGGAVEGVKPEATPPATPAEAGKANTTP